MKLYNGLEFPDATTQDSAAASIPSGFKYTYSTDTTASDPGSGGIKFNNTTLASITSIRISETDADSGTLSSFILAMDDNGTGTFVYMVKNSDPSTYLILKLAGTWTDNGTWDSAAVSYIASHGSFSNSDTVRVSFSPVGATGSSTNVPGRYSWIYGSSTTPSGILSGDIRGNNASFQASTELYIGNGTIAEGDPSTIFSHWSQDHTQGTIYLTISATPGAWYYFRFTNVVNNSTYYTFSVTSIDSQAGTLVDGITRLYTRFEIDTLLSEPTLSARFIYDSSTSGSDPGTGKLRLNQSTQNTATIIRPDLADVNGTDITASLLDLLDDTGGTVKGFIRLAQGPDNWLLFSVASMASPSGYRDITVTCIGSSSASPFTNGYEISFSFTPLGVALDTDTSLTANSDTVVPSQKAIKAYADTKQPLDSDLTTIAGLTATTDNFIVSVASAWASRTPAQVKTTLALNNVDNTSNATERAATATLTNKRVTKRTGTVASDATPTINTDNIDFFSITALAVDITSFTTNLSGTPTEGQTLWIAITGTATRAIAWGASFEASTAPLPTTTVGTARLDIGFIWNSVTSKWRCVATA